MLALRGVSIEAIIGRPALGIPGRRGLRAQGVCGGLRRAGDVAHHRELVAWQPASALVRLCTRWFS